MARRDDQMDTEKKEGKRLGRKNRKRDKSKGRKNDAGRRVERNQVCF